MNRLAARHPAARRGRSAGPVVRLGYVPLLDAAPLLAARELGLFEKWGVAVELRDELGWASIREKLLYGEIEAAHAPALMAFSIHLGLQSRPCPVCAPFLLSRQGNAITLSKRLWQKGAHDLSSLRQIIRAEQPRRMTFAVVALFSSHHYLLRRWLESAGLNPEDTVRIVVLPPNLMGEHLREGSIDGFCSGEPWNSAAALAGDGWIAADSETLAPRHPEKVLLQRQSFVSTQPEHRAALVQALAEACHWCDLPANRPALADLLTASGVFDLQRPAIANALEATMQWGAQRSRPAAGFIRYHDGGPTRLDEWDCRQLLDQARRLGLPTLPSQLNIALARRLFLSAAPRRERQPEPQESTA